MGERTCLRHDLASLTQLVQTCARETGIDTAQLEKDFWVTETLRSVADSVASPDIRAILDQAEAVAVFKGGTSLSRAHRLIERFSEDVDVLIHFPSSSSRGQRDRVLKVIVERCRHHLGLAEMHCELLSSTTGIKRNIAFSYPRGFESSLLRRAVLLEMGSRGGTHPHQLMSFRSMIADHAIERLGEHEDSWPEFAPVSIPILNAERTLLEKCSALHSLAMRCVDANTRSLQVLAGGARHYYDIASLLEHKNVRDALTSLGQSGIGALMADIDQHTADGGWTYSPRPVTGFAASPAFDKDSHIYSAARDGFALIQPLVYGRRFTFEECLAMVHAYAHLL